MLAVKSANVRDNFKEWCDKISMGETVVVSRPQNKNIYMISEAEYNALQKAKRNIEYMSMIDESIAQFERGETITLTMDELKAMEQYIYWQMQDRKTLKKINSLIIDIKRNGALQGISRRIDEANRLVYSVDETQNIRIMSCKGHYED